jgi:hypothetical protein
MTMVQHDVDVVVRIEPWAGSDYARIRITTGYSQQLQSLLDDAHIKNSTAMEFSAGSDAMELISVTAGTPEFWEAMAAVVVAFIGRHAGKRVRVQIRDRTITDLKGYSSSDVERLLRTAAELQESAEAQERARWELPRDDAGSGSPEQLPDA